MKTIVCTAILAMFAMSIATPWLTSAHASGPSATGSYTFTLEDSRTKTLEFSASSDARGTTTGTMTFRDTAGIQEQDVDGTGERIDESTGEFYITASLDALTIEHNRALMSGTVRESSNPSYVGRWVQLVVEDNGDGKETPDKLSWCFCKPELGGWTPVDAENPHDPGASWHWWATDAELRDDYGMPSPDVNPGIRHGCPTFALSTYDFAEARGEGQIQVQP